MGQDAGAADYHVSKLFLYSTESPSVNCEVCVSSV